MGHGWMLIGDERHVYPEELEAEASGIRQMHFEATWAYLKSRPDNLEIYVKQVRSLVNLSWCIQSRDRWASCSVRYFCLKHNAHWMSNTLEVLASSANHACKPVHAKTVQHPRN